VRFETVVYRNAFNKDTMFMDFCKAKIIVFRGATAFAKALLSARITGRCCYGLVLSITEPVFSHSYFLINLFLTILPEPDFEIII